jgi:hypothetical protein
MCVIAACCWRRGSVALVGQMHAMAQVQTALERAVNITYIAKVRAPCRVAT